MKQSFTLFILLLLALRCTAQKDYADSMAGYWKQYVDTHVVEKGHDKYYFRFFKTDSSYTVNARFTSTTDLEGFVMQTSGYNRPRYFKYGTLSFSIHDTACTLSVYYSKDLQQMEQFKNYLFVPFTDATSGVDSYGGGRYLEFYSSDIKNNNLLIDFNKAYNPYCAYSNGYNCPIPPKENELQVAIKAGEQNFAKPH